MPGYTVKFVNPLLKIYECPICLFAMRNPVQTECGHYFCRECLEPVLKRRHPTCPLDMEEISQEGIFLDNDCRREILNLEVSCNFMRDGCSWIGHLKNLDEHLNKCDCRVLLILKAAEKRMTLKDISESTGKEVEEVTAILTQLFQRGKVSRGTDVQGNECWAIISQASGY